MDRDEPLVLVIFGTRPEAVKMAPVVQALRKTVGVRTKVCVTGQHREMLNQALHIFDIRPDYDLALMQPGQPLADLAARVLTHVTEVLKQEHPAAILVHGDTTTAMASALAAFYLQIPVGHVEAGLRTGNLRLPFPEELNRRIIDLASTWHFAPTVRAAQMLLHEGTQPDRVMITGNTVIDAIQQILARTTPPPLPFSSPEQRLIVFTAHRRENLGAPHEQAFRAIRALVERNPDIVIVYPIHLNPQVQEPAQTMLGGHRRIHLLPPLDYVSFVHLMARSFFIVTDSGGIQEEGAALGKPVLVMRQETERPEAIEAGVARLVGTDTETILREAERLLYDDAAYATMAQAASPFGDGHAAERIAVFLVERLGKGSVIPEEASR